MFLIPIINEIKILFNVSGTFYYGIPPWFTPKYIAQWTKNQKSSAILVFALKLKIIPQKAKINFLI